MILSPCLTQGAGATESIATGIQRLNLLTIDEPDLIIVARGGGSPEDLWAYNEEPVARAIFASDIPIISAVGHETDVSIADHVADRRARPHHPPPPKSPSPTEPKKLPASPDSARQSTRSSTNRIVDLTQRSLLRRERLERSAPHPPTMRIEVNRQQQHLDQAIERRFALWRAGQTARDSRLSALNPQATLQRGYAIVSDADGQVVASAAALNPDQDITLQFADGRVAATTTNRDDQHDR